jgi:hypothetical protein
VNHRPGSLRVGFMVSYQPTINISQPKVLSIAQRCAAA